MWAVRGLVLTMALLVCPSAGAETELILLGTGGGPAFYAARAQPASALVVDGTVYLVDCGNGVGAQLERAGLGGARLTDLRHVFVTHHHSDHVADLVTLPLLAWEFLEQPLTLHGPKPLKKSVKAGLKQFKFDLKIRVADEGAEPLKGLLEIHQFKRDGVVLEDARVKVTAARVAHVPIRDAFAYRFDTKDSAGVSVVFSGDTAPSDALVALAQGADVLVHELLALTPQQVSNTVGLPLEHPLVQHIINSHTSFMDVGRIAAEAGVGTLVLNHIVPSDRPLFEPPLLEEIRKSFAGEVVFGNDLDTFPFP